MALTAIAVAGCDRLLTLPAFSRDASIDVAPDVTDEPCPASYAPLPGGPANSAYRYEPSLMTWALAETACEAATPRSHITHLVVFDDTVEIALARTLIANAEMVHAGFAHDTGAADPRIFHTVTGMQIDQTSIVWDVGEPDGTSGTNEETVTWFGSSHLLVDSPYNLAFPFLCECDHHAATMTFTLH